MTQVVEILMEDPDCLCTLYMYCIVTSNNMVADAVDTQGARLLVAMEFTRKFPQICQRQTGWMVGIQRRSISNT